MGVIHFIFPDKLLSQIDSDAGRHREHPRVLAAVGGENPAFGRKGPTDFRFHEEAEVPVRVELDAAGAKQPECGTVFADGLSVHRGA